MQYGGFWRRFGAFLLDTLVWLPYGFLSMWLLSKFRLFYVYSFLPTLLLSLWFEIYLVKRYGGTPGKLIMNLQVVRRDGSPIGYREAILRASVLAILSALTGVAYAFAVLHLNDAEYLALTSHNRIQHIRAAAPPWFETVYLIQQIWVWSEFLVLLTNEKRRALHDFMAGTVVIQLSKAIQNPTAIAEVQAHDSV